MTNTSSRERAVVGVSSLALLLAVTSEELDISCQTEKWECGHAEPLSVRQHTPTAKKNSHIHTKKEVLSPHDCELLETAGRKQFLYHEKG